MEAWWLRNRYDAIISWAENLGIPFAFLQKATFSKTPHVGIFSWITKPKKAFLLKLVRKQFSRIILMSSVQRNAAMVKMRYDSSRVPLLRWPVDTKFWRPMDGQGDMICSVGREMRDYGTLIEALKEAEIPCHIAAGSFPGKKDEWLDAVKKPGALRPTLTIGKKTYFELRDLYARSRFVVMPILPTDTDNGTTSILEAMAMGKAVICSRVKGQADVIQEGKTGLFVPPHDPRALKNAILHLWNNPEIAKTMGIEGRKFVEQHHAIELWLDNVQSIVKSAVAEKRGVELQQTAILSNGNWVA